MAQKRRKSSVRKRKKKFKAIAGKTVRAQTRKRVLRKRRPRTLGDQVSSAYRTVIDTIKGTDLLRNKMEPRASSETE